jgi:hypothetical protein
MSVITPEISEIAFAIVIVIVYSTLYRDNPLYSMVESAMVAVLAAQPLVLDWRPGTGGMFRNVLVPLSEGNLGLIIPIILGILYFTVFSRQLIFLYRTVISLRIGSMIGFAMGSYLTVSMLGILELGRKTATTPSAFVGALAVIATVFYFTFSQWVDSKLGLVRRAGYWIVFIFYAGFGATLYLTRLDTMIGWVFKISRWPALVVPIIGFLLVLADLGIRRMRAVEVPAS